ncbi:MAG: hypothetical protein ABIY55_01995 [Kofleriaceae bacterium]
MIDATEVVLDVPPETVPDAPFETVPDAPPDATPDAPPDARPPDAAPDAAPPACDYLEAADGSNAATSEATSLTIGGTPHTVCGTINTGHFDTATKTVDTDRYRVTSDGTLPLIVRYFGATGAAELSVLVFDTTLTPTLLFGTRSNPTVDDHGAFTAVLPAGTYDVVVVAHATADLAAPIDYKLGFAPDAPGRCPAITAAASYTEAADGPGTGNDVIAAKFAVDPRFKLTTLTTDAPEPTGLTIDAVTPVRIAGSSANVNAADDYMDRDTYLVQTGPSTSELTLRLNWADQGVDLDYLVFPADQTTSTGESLLSTPGEEYNVVAVKPNTAYWIWIGSHDGSAVLPAAYDLSVCGTLLDTRVR